MKKIFVIAAMASFVLASCTKSSTTVETFATTGQKEVAIVTLAGNFTKGYIPVGTFNEWSNATASALACYRTMQVSGFRANAKDSSDFFVNKEFRMGTGIDGTTTQDYYANTKRTWVAYPERVFYPLGSSDRYTFLAYSDSVKNKATWNGARQVVLEVDTASLKYDIVASAFKASDNIKTENGPVAAKFNHTQAYITVQVSAKDAGTAAAKITIDTLSFKNVYNIGKLTLTYDPDSTDLLADHKPVIDWNFFGMCKCESLALPNGYFAEGTVGNDGTISANDSTGAKFFGVQAKPGAFVSNRTTLNNTGNKPCGYGAPVLKDSVFKFEALFPANQKPTSIEILYTVNGKQMSASWDISTKQTFESWKPGSHYVYNIKIGMYEVMIAPTIGADWDTVNPATTEDPVFVR